MAEFRATDPIEFCWIEANIGNWQSRCVYDVARHHANDRSITRGLVIQIVGRDNMARAGHILNYDLWITSEMITEMTREKSSPYIVVLPSRGSNDELNLLASIK